MDFILPAGASSDLEAATRSALGMVKYLGMSEKIGLRVYPTDDGKPNDLGPKTSELIDAEVNKILNDSYDRAIMILKTHRYVNLHKIT